MVNQVGGQYTPSIKPFGTNVISTAPITEETARALENAVGAMLEPVLDYFEKNDRVFSGEVAMEIAHRENEEMLYGMVLGGMEEQRNLDINW